ncbi:MAG: hypothetical protein KDD60_09390, partial [Bdellovibrionales bacterium]|nr:hypothetical protein [Bdellovibrionales bacterium]
ISPDGICNLQSAPTSPISPTGYVRTPVLPKGIVYQHQIAQGCELNNLRPLRTISLHEEQKEVTQFPRLNDVQCFHALYEIAADTLLESGLFDRADLFESPFDREVIQEKEREHYHLLRVAQKRGFLFAAYLHPEFEEAVLHRPKNPKMLSISGYLNSMRLFSCDTMASTVRSQGATPLRFEGGKLTPQVCDLIEQLHDYVAANRYTLRLLEDSLSYLLQHASSQWKPSTEHVRDALSLALSTSAEIFANRRDMPDIEKVLRLGTCLVLMDPKNSPLKDIKKSSYHDLKSVCATILSTLQGNHQTA